MGMNAADWFYQCHVVPKVRRVLRKSHVPLARPVLMDNTLRFGVRNGRKYIAQVYKDVLYNNVYNIPARNRDVYFHSACLSPVHIGHYDVATYGRPDGARYVNWNPTDLSSHFASSPP